MILICYGFSNSDNLYWKVHTKNGCYNTEKIQLEINVNQKVESIIHKDNENCPYCNVPLTTGCIKISNVII